MAITGALVLGTSGGLAATAAVAGGLLATQLMKPPKMPTAPKPQQASKAPVYGTSGSSNAPGIGGPGGLAPSSSTLLTGGQGATPGSTLLGSSKLLGG